MTTETMTLHRALAELKLLDKRIKQELEDHPIFTAAIYTGTKMIDGVDIEQARKNAKAWMNKMQAMYARRSAIKRAVIQKNAEVFCDIPFFGETLKLSIAEMVDLKNSLVPLYDEMNRNLRACLEAAVQAVETKEASFEYECQSYISQMIGRNASSTLVNDPSTSKEATAFIESLRKTYAETNTPKMFDPLDMRTITDNIRDSVDKALAAIDASLSEANATSTITVEYNPVDFRSQTTYMPC